MGKLIGIFVAPAGGAPMKAIAEAILEPSRGIAGDRYYSGTGTFSDALETKPDSEVTLIASEQIAYFNQQTGLSLSYGDPRRNLVTEGVDLNALVGKQFRIGGVVLQGIRLCEPCAHLASLVARQVLPVLVHRAGLRAQIIAGGKIKHSDAIETIA